MTDASRFVSIAGQVARLLLGPENKSLSSKTELRFGKNGSIAVDLAKGTWYDFSEEKGGGVLDLVAREKGFEGKDAIEWLKAQGFDVSDDRDPPKAHHNGNGAQKGAPENRPQIVKTYDYLDEDGRLVFQVCRLEPKTFRQRRPDGKGGWNWSVKDILQVPYRLPELLQDISRGVVYIVEGEKDADNLRAAGIPATCNAMGAGKWPDELCEFFRGADVCILPDNDEPGRKHVELVASKLTGVAKRIRVLNLPVKGEKEDASDWLAVGGTALDLADLLNESATDWRPGLIRAPSKFGGAFVHEIAGQKKTRDWLIKGAVLAKTFSLIIGAPGCGKSFLILDYALTAALCAVRPEMKPEWFGRKIKPCGVVYVSAEGQEDFVFRIQAWLEDNRVDANKLPFYLIPTAVDLCTTTEGARSLAEEIKTKSQEAEAEFGVPFSVVIIDTVSRALAGGDENSPAAMGAFVKNCGAIKDQCGIAVIGIHHTPMGSDRARGHSSLHGATDAEIIVTKAEDGQPNRWKIGRSKCGPTGAYHEFRLRRHDLGTDEDGDPVTSCVVSWLGGEPSHEEAELRDNAELRKTGKPQFTPDGRAILGDNLTASMQALQNALDKQGEFPPHDIRAPHGRVAVKLKTWLEEMVRLLPGDDKEDAKFRDRCRKARDAASLRLHSRGIIGLDGDWVWRTERRIASVDKPDFSAAEPQSSSQIVQFPARQLAGPVSLDQEISY